jgi:hypothetical protein
MQKYKTAGYLAGLFILMIVAGLTAQPARAVEPNFVPGNPSCTDLGYDFGFKPQPEPPPSGTYSFPDGIHSVSITSDGTYFDWASDLGIDAVIVKGGPNANVYVYDPEAFSDSGLRSPINASNDQPYAISHIEFCYDYEVDVSKSAETSFTRTFEWDISKDVDPAEFMMFAGESDLAGYDITLTKTGYEDSAWAVSGSITIENNTPYDATITGVVDMISGGIAASVDCGAPFEIVLAAGDSLTCDYSAALPDGSSRVNTATVNTDGIVGGGEATAAVTFGEPTTEVNAQVNVSDDYGTLDINDDLSFGPAGDSTVFSYDRTFACSDDPAAYTDGYYDYSVTNVASIDETGQSDDASVTVKCYAPIVSKDADTSYTRTYEWSIDKSVDPGMLELLAGGSDDAGWKVVVSPTGYTDSAWAVSGTITVQNPHPTAAMAVSLYDAVSPGIDASLDCGGVLNVPAGGSATCEYSASLPDGSDRTNTVSASLNGIIFNAYADVTFGSPTTVIDDSVSVEDDLEGALGTASLPNGNTFNYDRTYECSSDPADYVDGFYSYDVDNTATIVETGQSDDAGLTVNCYAPVVSKTATPGFTRTYSWSIDKSADQSDLVLSAGQLFLVNYSVTVDVTGYVDSEFAVEGTITVSNNSPLDMQITNLDDEISGGISASVKCDGIAALPTTLAAGDTLNCSYSASLPDASSRLNTATARMNGIDFSGTADVIFSGPTAQVDECIDVSDTNVGSLGTVCVTEAPATFNYSLWFGSDSRADVVLVCGDNQHVNTASFAANDSGASGEDSWTVNATVACGYGCTLTPGYWKTHSDNGPAPYDDTWALLGENTPFFSSGQSYYEVLWTNPQGNAYYILAHAYIAAELNQLNGSSIPADVLSAYDAATVLFQTYTPDEVAGLKGKDGKDLRAQFIDLAYTLDEYNNGLLGPGHCSE